MKKVIFLSLVVSFSMLFSNCGTVLNAYAPTIGVHGGDHGGILFSKTVRSEDFPKELGTKEGRACQNMVLLLAAWGDASVPAAMKAGDISKIKHISYEKTRGLLGIAYMQDCIILNGD